MKERDGGRGTPVSKAEEDEFGSLVQGMLKWKGWMKVWEGEQVVSDGA